MPRRKPRHLDAVRFEMGTKERELAESYIWTQAVAKGGGFLALGAGIAVAGFFMYNTIEDIYRWIQRGWETGFGLVEDPAATSAQVSGAIAPSDSNLSFDEMPEGYPSLDLTGMSIYTIYDLGTQNRKKVLDFLTLQLSHARDLPIYPAPGAGASEYALRQEFQNYLFMKTWPLCLQDPTLASDGTTNAMSEYGYQITIREISARNDFAQTAGVGLFGLGLGVQWLARTSGFMQTEAWDGNDWKTAPGAITDPLLSFAWARTNFETGNWWSTADAPGGNSFAQTGGGNDVRTDVFLHTVPGADRTSGKFSADMGFNEPGRWSYEEVLYCAAFEIENYVGTATPCPFLEYILAPLGLSVASVQGPGSPPLEDEFIGPLTAEDAGYNPAWKEAGYDSYEEYAAEAQRQMEDRKAKMEREGRERAENYAETGLKETNEERRDREQQEEWQRQRDEGNPGYGDDADDNGETEEERRAREDEESGPPRV